MGASGDMSARCTRRVLESAARARRRGRLDRVACCSAAAAPAGSRRRTPVRSARSPPRAVWRSKRFASCSSAARRTTPTSGSRRSSPSTPRARSRSRSKKAVGTSTTTPSSWRRCRRRPIPTTSSTPTPRTSCSTARRASSSRSIPFMADANALRCRRLQHRRLSRQSAGALPVRRHAAPPAAGGLDPDVLLPQGPAAEVRRAGAAGHRLQPGRDAPARPDHPGRDECGGIGRHLRARLGRQAAVPRGDQHRPTRLVEGRGVLHRGHAPADELAAGDRRDHLHDQPPLRGQGRLAGHRRLRVSRGADRLPAGQGGDGAGVERGRADDPRPDQVADQRHRRPGSPPIPTMPRPDRPSSASSPRSTGSASRISARSSRPPSPTSPGSPASRSRATTSSTAAAAPGGRRSSPIPRSWPRRRTTRRCSRASRSTTRSPA